MSGSPAGVASLLARWVRRLSLGLFALVLLYQLWLFAWVVLPDYMDAMELQMKCLEKKVAFVPGGSFFPNGGHENTLRLNYSCMPEEKIVQGITALCQTIRENLK